MNGWLIHFTRFIQKEGKHQILGVGFIKADYRNMIWEYGIRDACNTAHLYIVYNLIMERLNYNSQM